MTQDWYVDSIDDVERTAQALSEALESLVEMLGVARQQRLGDVPLLEIITGVLARGGVDARRRVELAFREFEHAVTAYRARATRFLVDEGGLTRSEVAGLSGVSRQMTGRLYNHRGEHG
jgi:hypothetical protein